MEQVINNSLILKQPAIITSADTDMEARLRIGALINLYIQAAINSAENLGFGFSGLKQQKLFWVLSRLTVDIIQPLMWYSNVEVETWPKDIDGLLYLRDFQLHNKGVCVSRATSGWLAIDIETKRPKLIEGLKGNIFMELKDKHAIKSLPQKLEGVNEGDIFEIKSTYYDLDLNKHVTSSRYIDWMIDTLPIDYLISNYPKKLSINYMKETMPGETIRIIRKQDGTTYHFEGVNVGKKSPAFRGCIEF